MLEVIEFQKDESEELELLNGTMTRIKRWGQDLPTRLKVMHSHWLLHKKRVVLVRGIQFDDCDISFLIRLDDKFNQGAVQCIEKHSKDKKQLKSALQKQDRDILVCQQSLILDVLKKFLE